MHNNARIPAQQEASEVQLSVEEERHDSPEGLIEGTEQEQTGEQLQDMNETRRGRLLQLTSRPYYIAEWAIALPKSEIAIYERPREGSSLHA